ncbi:MAG: helix-turn-helix domain-containing protein [Dehalococcoidia bacterium]|nr:helix-turn-helix domain-containing protein [Dehalococcoidia bacterium]
MKAKSKNSRMLTTSEVAHLLHVHPNTVRHWANEELIHTYRLGTRGDRRFKRGDVDSFIGRNRHKPQ